MAVVAAEADVADTAETIVPLNPSSAIRVRNRKI